MDSAHVSTLAGARTFMGIASKLPWQVKLLAKLMLARLPIPYGFWRSMGLFRHGEMNQPQRAVDTFHRYFERASHYVPLSPGFTSLELGPGDSILSGCVAKAYGAGQSWLVDAGHFATTDVAACKETVRLLQALGKSSPDIATATNLAEIMAAANIHYLTEGTVSLQHIPDASVDFIWSQVVLEHVPKAEFLLLMKELRRIIKPHGIAIHSVDFRDHLSGGLNNLRFASRIWESHYFQHSGFYTNRLRPNEMLAMFRVAGFSVDVIHEMRWQEMPIQRHALAREFQHLPDDALMVAEIEVVLKPNRPHET